MNETWNYEETRRVTALDTETFLMGPGKLAPELVCLTYKDDGAPNPVLLDAADGLEQFRGLLWDDQKLLVLANAPYDLGILAQADPSTIPDIFQAYQDRRIADVQTWQRLYIIAKGASKFDPVTGRPPTYFLETLVSYWLSESMGGKHGEDPWRFKYGTLADVPVEKWPEEAKQYALLDAEYTLRVWLAQTEACGVPPDFWNQCKYHWPLHLMSAYGLRTQRKAVEMLREDVETHVDAAMPKLFEAGIYRWGGTKKAPKPVKNMQVLRDKITAAYALQDLEPPRTDPTERFPDGQVQTSDEILEQSKDPDLKLLADIGADQKLLSTYVPKLYMGAEFCLNPRYTPVVDTGRTSSSDDKRNKGFGINVQNQPRRGGVRECFMPRVGYIYVDIDYNIAELRSLSQVLLDLFGESEMARSILEGDKKGKGYDVHCVMGAAIMQLPIDEYAARFRTGEKLCKDMRQLAKAADFGVPGGLGPATFVEYARVSYGVEIDDARAAELIELFKSTFPEMRRYFFLLSQKSQSGSFSLKQHRSGRERGGLSYCNGANTLFQGLTADGAKFAVYNVSYECYVGKQWDTGEPSVLFGCRPVAFIHDEIMLEAPFEIAVAAAHRASAVMCASMNQFTPDVPAVAEPCLMRRWYKDAETEVDGNGTLVPWTPKKPGKVLAGVDPQGLLKDLHGSRLWTAGELAAVRASGLGKKPNDPKDKGPDWKLLHRMWELELMAREENPDPWC